MSIAKLLRYFLIVLFLAGVLLTIFLWLNSNLDEKRTLSSDIFVGVVIFLSVAVAIWAYVQARTNDEYKIAEERRHFYITDPVMRKVRMLVQHNDIELQALVLITNIVEVRQPNILSKEAFKMRNNFDDYLNYMEGVAILANRGSMFKESIEGLWTYYFKGLRRSHTLDFDTKEVQVAEINKCIDSLCASSEAASRIKQKLGSLLSDGSSEAVRQVKKRGFVDWIIDQIKHFLAWVLRKKSESLKVVRDPIERKYMKNSEKAAIIDPVKSPIWFYVNNPGYEFVPIIKFEKGIYGYDSKLYKDKQEWIERICLDKDSLEPISPYTHHNIGSSP